MADLNIINKIEQIPAVPKTEALPVKVAERAPELAAEKIASEIISDKEGKATKERNASPITVTAASATSDDYHARREKEIDTYLSEGLSETFLAMPADKQKIFKTEAETTAKKINVLLDATKINISKIVKLIRRWLSLITGINKFFLDQEAKIKADKIIKIKNKL